MENTREFKRIESRLPQALHIDRGLLREELNRIKGFVFRKSKPEEDIKKRLSNLEKRLSASIEKKARRKAGLPRLDYNEALPITAKREEIIDSIKKNRVIIISGETGSGKTTQIPKFCLAAGRGVDGLIGCTQPRRIAAITVASRIAEELGEEVGQSVGHKIRFQNKTSENGYIKIMTDGILLAETQQGDPYLNAYDTLIVDEAHERSLNIDFILGILKTLLKKRRDLKLIITSATIDTEKFSAAFDHAPVIEVSGRMFPVEVDYFPVDYPQYEDKTHVELAALAVDTILRKSQGGDILVFMPTEQDILETKELIEGRNHPGLSVFVLFARLSAREQSAVYSKVPGRKIIVATNIAETSLTIPGIKFVVDTGLARISQYMPRSRTTALPVVAISKSSADQRKGRCGRISNGMCIRLYAEDDYQNRPLFTPPEMLRANLAEVILRMIALRLGDIADFPFIDSPPLNSIKDGFNTLLELGAIAYPASEKPSHQKSRFHLTPIGEIMAKMPVDPRLSRMLIEAKKEGCLKEIAIIVSALSIQDPRERPAEKEQAADQAHSRFIDPSSDFLTLLNIWNFYMGVQKKSKSGGQMKKICQQHFLSYRRMREWSDIHSQIFLILEECGFRETGKHAGQDGHGKKDEEKPGFTPLYSAIHRSILSGYLSNIAFKKEKNLFNAAKEREVMIFPGSGLFNKAGSWIVAAEIVETSRVFARTVANITPEWLEALGGFLCKHTYLDPHWERKSGQVVASCQVSLFGLIIVPSRPVPYGKVNPAHASEIFIRKALVENDVNPFHFNKHFPFAKYNQELIAEIEEMEDRVRRRDIRISDEEIFRFYQERLEGISDIRSLQKLLKEKGGDAFLRMNKTDLLRYLPDKDELSLFPNSIAIGNMDFECSYKFNPGKTDDGVTVKIPAAAVSSVPADSTDWLVPGLFREKLTALVKGLPKEYRRALVPISNTVDIIMNEMPKTSGAIISALGEFIHRRFHMDIPATAWPEAELPDHLRMRISIVRPDGKEIQSSRDKVILLQDSLVLSESGKMGSDEFERAKRTWEKTGLTTWDFSDLPESICLTGKKGTRQTFYPGLEKEQGDGPTATNLRLFLHQDQALKSHKMGIRTLYSIHFSKELKFLQKGITLPKAISEIATYFGGSKMIEAQIYDHVITELFYRDIRTKEDFYSHGKSAASLILPNGRMLMDCVIPVLEAHHESRSFIYSLETGDNANKATTGFLNALREELNILVPASFITLYDMDRLRHMVRYIKAFAIRAHRAMLDLKKDQMKSDEIKLFSDGLRDLLKTLTPKTSAEKRDAIESFHWLIEEYKVSVFAQELKTPFPVSKKRLLKKLQEIERMI